MTKFSISNYFFKNKIIKLIFIFLSLIFLEEDHHVLCVLPQNITHILNKLILIFLPFLCLSFLFFSCIFLASKPKNSHSQTQNKNFKPQHYLIKPVPLPSKIFSNLPLSSKTFTTLSNSMAYILRSSPLPPPP